jgi:hypothetical protein
MIGSLKIITPPSVEPITADEVKLHSHISHSIEDGLIENWIKSARLTAEEFQRRSYIAQTLELSIDYFPKLPLLLPRPPLIWVQSIKYYDCADNEVVLYEEFDNPITTTEDPGTPLETNSDFIIDTDSDPGRICHAYGVTWPATTLREINSFKIRYLAGYGASASDVPANIKDAIILLCNHKNENRASENDIIPKQFYDLLRPDRVFI